MRRGARRRAAVAVVVVLGPLAACSSSDPSGGASSSDEAAPTTTTTETTGAGTSSSAPNPQAVVDTARSSVQGVVLLHNVAAGLPRPDGLPGNAAAGQAAQLVEQFTGLEALLAEIVGSSPVSASAEALRGALGDYAGLAEVVLTAAESSTRELPGSFAGRLAKTDTTWKQAVAEIGDQRGIDLLVNLPPLLMSEGSSSTVPPPPK